jgi:hypothetical protein
MRYNGDRDRLSFQLQKLMAHPGYDLRVLEPLNKVLGSWTCLVETFETGAPGPFCGACGVVVDDKGEYSAKENFFYCVDCGDLYISEN